MNQLIVILLILRNWFKPFRSTAIKIVFCLIGLLLSLYVYEIYNSLQCQNISISLIEKGKDSIEWNHIDLFLDYGNVQETPYYSLMDSIPRNGTSVLYRSFYGWPSDSTSDNNQKDTFLFDMNYIIDTINSNNFDGKIKQYFINASQFTYLSVLMDYQDNNWLFPHPTEDFKIRKDELKAPIITQDSISEHFINIQQFQEMPYSRIKVEKAEHNIMPFTFKRKKHYYLYEFICANNELVYTFPTITSPQRFYSPHFYSAYDVSKLELNIHFEVDTLSSFTIHLENSATIDELFPSPDIKNARSITYKDPEKIKAITQSGLFMLIHFPKSETLQESRNYILSAIITLFLTLISTLLFNHIRKSYFKRKKYINFIKVTQECHPNMTLNFIKHLVMYDIVVCCILGVIIAICNPYNYKTIELATIILFLLVLVPLFLYYFRLNKYINNSLFIKTKNKVKFILLICVLTFTTILSIVSWLSKQEDVAEYFGIITVYILIFVIYLLVRYKKNQKEH